MYLFLYLFWTPKAETYSPALRLTFLLMLVVTLLVIGDDVTRVLRTGEKILSSLLAGGQLGRDMWILGVVLPNRPDSLVVGVEGADGAAALGDKLVRVEPIWDDDKPLVEGLLVSGSDWASGSIGSVPRSICWERFWFSISRLDKLGVYAEATNTWCPEIWCSWFKQYCKMSSKSSETIKKKYAFGNTTFDTDI